MTAVTTESNPATAQRKRGAALEDAILEAAYAELSEVGYSTFSVEGVAAAGAYRKGQHLPALAHQAGARPGHAVRPSAHAAAVRAGAGAAGFGDHGRCAAHGRAQDQRDPVQPGRLRHARDQVRGRDRSHFGSGDRRALPGAAPRGHARPAPARRRPRRGPAGRGRRPSSRTSCLLYSRTASSCSASRSPSGRSPRSWSRCSSRSSSRADFESRTGQLVGFPPLVGRGSATGGFA